MEGVELVVRVGQLRPQGRAEDFGEGETVVLKDLFLAGTIAIIRQNVQFVGSAEAAGEGLAETVAGVRQAVESVNAGEVTFSILVAGVLVVVSDDGVGGVGIDGSDDGRPSGGDATVSVFKLTEIV